MSFNYYQTTISKDDLVSSMKSEGIRNEFLINRLGKSDIQKFMVKIEVAYTGGVSCSFISGDTGDWFGSTALTLPEAKKIFPEVRLVQPQDKTKISLPPESHGFSRWDR